MNLPLQMDRGASVPLQDQLFEQLRQLILTGKLKPNFRIIATRFLAEQLGVSRTTVLLAYERLISEGYLETRPAVGTFVCAEPPEPALAPCVPNSFSDVLRQAAVNPPSAGTATHSHGSDGVVDLSVSRFDSSHLLPPKLWLQGLRTVLEQDPDGPAKSLPPAGVLSLRKAIADNLGATRGIIASPEQVMIVFGQRQACSLVAHLFQGRGDRVVVETPGDENVVNFFKARHAEVIPVPVDEYGLETDRLPQGPISLVHVTPARQNPVGGIMPPPRRKALLEWAHASGAYILEDDCNSDYRYQGTTPQALAALDPHGLTFYTSSFARTLGAGLGLGYLVVPAEFVDAVTAIKSMSDEGGQWLEQMALAELITSGKYEHHMRRVRKIYLERRDSLIHALEHHFGDVTLVGSETGTQLTWLLPSRFPSARLACDAARSVGLHLEPMRSTKSSCGARWRYEDRALQFGYAASTPRQIKLGIAKTRRGAKPLIRMAHMNRGCETQP